jgi:CPA2 family monovalent cation:H+ antiporter-2
METAFITSILFVLGAALVGGLIAKFLKLQPIIGYLVAGLVFGNFYNHGLEIEKLAEIGVILLLFSVGIELSFSRLSRVFKAITLAAILQILITAVIFYFLIGLMGFSSLTSLILSIGFSLSSTAVVVKILIDRGETETIFGELALGWLLIQDLAVIPILVLLPTLSKPFGVEMLLSAGQALLIAGVVVTLAIIIGRHIAPYFIHKVAAANSRELLVVAAVFLAVGTAVGTSLFGISPALGAFLAGVVISESQENHAVFVEIRPLRDLFVAIFFVTLGLLIDFSIIKSHLLIIVLLVVLVILIKFIIIFFLSIFSKHRGKTAVALGLGLAQVGEFAFVVYTQAFSKELISFEMASVGILVALISLMITPLLFKGILPAWRRLRDFIKDKKFLSKFILGWDRDLLEKEVTFENHIIICGYGRVGGWVGRAFGEAKVPFVVIEYNSDKVSKLKRQGIEVIYGDPTHAEVLEAAGIMKAKAVIVTVPDRVVQEELTAYVQTKAPQVKIISSVHYNEEWEKLKMMKVDKIIQPEFEAALTITRIILTSIGREKEKISEIIKSLRISHARNIK